MNQPRREILVAQSQEIPEGDRRIVAFGDSSIGVYRKDNVLYAYENVCPHQGGPACEGLMMPKVEQRIAEDKTYIGTEFNYNDWHIVCPWHAWEYKLTTGENVCNSRYRLKKFDAFERDGEVFIIADADYPQESQHHIPNAELAAKTPTKDK